MIPPQLSRTLPHALPDISPAFLASTLELFDANVEVAHTLGSDREEQVRTEFIVEPAREHVNGALRSPGFLSHLSCVWYNEASC